jgi:hypothetical protein
MAKRKKKISKQAKIILSIVLVAIVALVALYIYMTDQQQKALAAKTAEMQVQIDTAVNNYNSVQRQAVRLAPGVNKKYREQITKDDVEEATVSSDLDQDSFITMEDLPCVANLKLKAGEPIMKNQVSDEDYNDLQEMEISYVNLNTNLKENDVIDVRIRFNNGEDYTVISKKNCRTLNLAASDFFMWLTEDEILSLSSAAVDAYLNKASLYVTRYMNPVTQDATIVDYQPTLDVMTEMAQDPNIVDLAKRSLSVSARNYMQERLKKFEESLVITDADGNKTDREVGEKSPTQVVGGTEDARDAAIEKQEAEAQASDAAITSPDTTTTTTTDAGAVSDTAAQ